MRRGRSIPAERGLFTERARPSHESNIAFPFASNMFEGRINENREETYFIPSVLLPFLSPLSFIISLPPSLRVVSIRDCR